jgi:hypothetical protein
MRPAAQRLRRALRGNAPGTGWGAAVGGGRIRRHG